MCLMKIQKTTLPDELQFQYIKLCRIVFKGDQIAILQVVLKERPPTG